MLISKFNRIIRSRLVWTILGGIFALSLVVFIGPNTDSCVPTAETGPVEGILNGKPVNVQDFSDARFFELRMREPSTLSEEAQARLRQRVWARLAALQAAESMGITVSDEEVASLIQNHRGFQRNGAFDKNLYTRTIVEQVHRPNPIATFEESVRQDIALQKLFRVIQSAVWSPASEINSKLRSVTDLLTVQGAVLRRSQLAPAPTVTPEDARRLFDERPEMFKVPDRRAVRYVRFPLKDAEQPAPSDDDIRAFYDDNAEKYQTTGTNGPVPIPIAQVRAEIVSNLQHRAAAAAAREQAMAFEIKLQPDRRGKTPESIEALAASEGMQVHTSRLFSVNDRLPEFRTGQEFAKAAFALESGSTQQADGENAVFVMALYTNIESHLPDFSNVVNRAMSLTRDRKQSELFQNRCTEIRKAVAEAVGAGKSFNEATAPFRLAVTNFPVFSLYSPNAEQQDFDHSDTVKPAVMSLQKGAVSDVLSLDDDAMIVFMKDRKPGDQLEAEMLRPQLTAEVNRYRANLVFSDWQDYLLKVGALDDRTLKAQERAKEAPDQEAPALPRRK